MQKVVAALTVAPLLACVLLQLLHVDAYEISRGDVATLELRILHAMRFEQALGPYSRFDVSHPGPLFFYLMAPIYALSGRAAGSMYVAAAAINLAATIGIVRVAWTRVTGTLPRAAVLVGVAVVLGVLVGAHSPLALATPWNPFVTIVPFGLLLVLVAAADSPSRAWVVGVVVLHAFVAQTHAMYLLPASVVLALGLVWRGRSRDAIVALVLVVVLWLPPAIDEIFGTHNLRNVADVATEHARLGLTGAETWTTLVDRIAFGSSALFVALVLGLAASRWRLRGEPHTFRARLVVIAIVTLAAATFVITRLDAPRGYLVAWLWIVAFVAWLAVALAWVPAELPGRARVLPMIVAAIAACGSGYHQLSVMTIRMRKLAAAKPARTQDVERLVAQYEALRGDEAALLVNRVPHDWHVFVALVLQLYKRGVPFVVEPKWTHMLGEGIPNADDAARTIDMVERNEAAVLIAEPDRKVNATILDAIGVDGDLAVLTDGDAPADGVHATAHNSVQLVGGSIVLRLDTDAERLRITAIGDDWFRIEGSFDGVRFDQLTLTPRAGSGLRTQEIDLPPSDIRPYPFLRISTHDGPWPFWIAELTALGRAP